MKLVYICGRFRGDNHWEIHQNVLKAEAVIPHLISQGYAPICMHKITENLQGLFPDETYLDICIKVLSACQAIYMLKGWQKSEGSKQEWEYATSHGIEVMYES